MVLVGWEKLKIWLRLHNSSNRSIAAAPRIIDNSIENNPHYIDPTISNAPVLSEELDIRSSNFFMLWYFSNITKSVTVLEVDSTNLAQSENKKLLIEQPVKSESILIMSESTYKNRPLVPELATDVFNSDIAWNIYNIGKVLSNIHIIRLLNILPLDVFYPGLNLKEIPWVVVVALWTTKNEALTWKPGSLPSVKRNLDLPNADDAGQITLNIFCVKDLCQVLADDGTRYYQLQERIGDNISKLPPEIFIEEEVLPVRVFLPLMSKSSIFTQDQLFPAKFLYNENFYKEAHQAGLYSGIEATNFCYNYLGLDYKLPVSKYDTVLSGGEDFLHKDKFKNRKFTDIIHPYPSKPDTE